MKVNYGTSLSDLIAEVKKNHGDCSSLGKIKAAYQFAFDHHTGQKRMSGADFITHPTATAFFLASWHMPSPVIIAGLLHDLIEDTTVTFTSIKKRFGIKIAVLVRNVTKITKISEINKQSLSSAYLQQIFLGMAHDVQTIFVKLADRLHNLLTIKFLPASKQQKVAQESLNIFAPIAQRLGMRWVAEQYCDICCQVLYSEQYGKIRTWLNQKQLMNQQIIFDLVKKVKNLLFKHGLKVTVTGRIKSIYSIFKKIYLKGKTIDTIYDILAIRIIADDEASCYLILGYIHTTFVPLPNRFKDYIAVPKTNFYQAIHTAIVLPNGYFLEVQIRTRKMDYIAEFGIAAHWKYKMNFKSNKPHLLAKINLPFVDQLQQTKAMVATQDQSDQVLDWLEREILVPHVYAITPQRELVELPAGASVIDFAYAIHSKIGDHMNGALVNGKLVNFGYLVESGDVIEIKTDPNQITCKPAWLNYVKTNKAQRKIKKILNVQPNKTVEVELKPSNTTAALLVKGRSIFADFINEQSTIKPELPMMLKLKLAKITPTQQRKLWLALAQNKLSVAKLVELMTHDQLSLIVNDTSHLTRKKPHHYCDILINDEPVNIRSRFAGCCLPVPGESIGGFISSKKMIYVHSTECPNFGQKQHNHHRLVKVSWNPDPSWKIKYSTKILVSMSDNPGFLNKISAYFIKQEVGLASVVVKQQPRMGNLVIYLKLEVKHKQQLNSVMNYLSSFANVHAVKRLRA